LEKTHVYRNKEALEVFNLGIARKATPVERLTLRLKEFQKRMTLNAPADPEAVPPEDVQPSKIAPKMFPKTNLNHKLQKSNAPSSFEVFRDTHSESTQIDPQDLLPSSSSGSKWNEFDDLSSQRKENVREATVWTGATLAQKPTKSKKADVFNVFKDEVGSRYLINRTPRKK
jgi:hypothetical protein